MRVCVGGVGNAAGGGGGHGGAVEGEAENVGMFFGFYKMVEMLRKDGRKNRRRSG